MSFKHKGQLEYKLETEVQKIHLSSIEEGSNTTKDFIIYKDEELIKVFSRKCDHNNGKLCKQNEKIICPLHGWDFNPKTGAYNNIQVVKKEEDFKVENEEIVIIAKKLVPQLPSVNGDYELSVELLSHATLLFKSKDFSFATDPWVEGFAFASGWWVLQKTPKLWEEKLNAVDFIYVSHNHPDHLNEFTLKKIRRDMHFIVPAFENDSVSKLLKRYGFDNITKFELGSYYQYQDKDVYFSILKSGDFRDDSGFYFSYGNFSCLSSVDSNDLNFSRLPKDVTLYCSSFAGGASGYPICFDNIDEERKEKIIERNRKAIRATVANQIRLCGPKYFLPYAGFFSEGAPRDGYIKSLNRKNSPRDYVEVLKKLDVEVFDSATDDLFLFDGDTLREVGKVTRNQEFPHDDPVAFYSAVFSRSVIDDAFITNFFQESQFQDDLKVYFHLTDDDFLDVKKSFIVDFSDKAPSVLFEDFDWVSIKECFKPSDDSRYLFIKVREDSFSWVLKNNMPFEDLSIGFQCRIDRVPDMYNVSFWDYFTNVYI